MSGSRDRDVRLFLTAYATSIVGSAMVPVALTFAVLNEGYRVADVSYVLAAETVPLLSAAAAWAGSSPIASPAR